MDGWMDEWIDGWIDKPMVQPADSHSVFRVPCKNEEDAYYLAIK